MLRIFALTRVSPDDFSPLVFHRIARTSWWFIPVFRIKDFLVIMTVSDHLPFSHCVVATPLVFPGRLLYFFPPQRWHLYLLFIENCEGRDSNYVFHLTPTQREQSSADRPQTLRRLQTFIHKGNSRLVSEIISLNSPMTCNAYASFSYSLLS